MTRVTALSGVIVGDGERVNAAPWLREKKSRKYMGVQDELAVVSAGRALAAAGLAASLPSERSGLYLAVGYIPFEERDIDPVLSASLDAAGEFSIERFSTEGYLRAHPLLAFRCLPNMPAYHVAANFGIEGPYHVGYPSAGQLYLAIEAASEALAEDDVDVAVVVGVAHQRNFLVEHHMRRIGAAVEGGELCDAAAALVLEGERFASERGAKTLGRLAELSIDYLAFDPLEAVPPRREQIETGMAGVDGAALAHKELGPASPLCLLEAAWKAGAERVVHRLSGRDGIAAHSLWLREGS
jgi:3-oxoacyl-(acyl-carrier-protein) synthase